MSTSSEDDHTLSDLLACAGADLLDVAQRIVGLPAELQHAAAVLELSTITTARDPLTSEIASLLQVIAHAVTTSDNDQDFQ